MRRTEQANRFFDWLMKAGAMEPTDHFIVRWKKLGHYKREVLLVSKEDGSEQVFRVKVSPR